MQNTPKFPWKGLHLADAHKQTVATSRQNRTIQFFLAAEEELHKRTAKVWSSDYVKFNGVLENLVHSDFPATPAINSMMGYSVVAYRNSLSGTNILIHFN